MQDINENRIAHLVMIQDVIKRMASNSFLVKGWSITLVSALVALAIANKSMEIAYLVIVPAVIFWALDAYWLRQERLFRKLYDHVRTVTANLPEDQMFSMDTSPFSNTVPRLIPTLFNLRVWILHGCIVATAIVVVTIVVTGNGVGG